MGFPTADVGVHVKEDTADARPTEALDARLGAEERPSFPFVATRRGRLEDGDDLGGPEARVLFGDELAFVGVAAAERVLPVMPEAQFDEPRGLSERLNGVIVGCVQGGPSICFAH